MREDPDAPDIIVEGTKYKRYKVDNVASCASCSANNNLKICEKLKKHCDFDAVYIIVKPKVDGV